MGDRRTVRGVDVFVVDQGPRGPGEGTVVLLHGYPTCSYDFYRILPLLARGYRVVAHDHPGFGLSRKPRDYSYSLVDQADVALELWRELGVREAHLVAHDYGTSVATEILARRDTGWEPVTLRSVTLANGSIYVEMARLRPIQRILRNPWLGWIAARAVGLDTFKRQMRRVAGDPDALSDLELETLWELLEREGGRDRIPQITGYLHERRRFRRRWTEPLSRLGLPTHVLWGLKDPVAVEAIGRRLAREIPGAVFTPLEELGHFPMLEDPDGWGREVLDFLHRVDGIR